MSTAAITVDQLGRIYCRSLHSALLYGLADGMRRLVGRPQRNRLRRDEFWALRDLSFSVAPGECLGVIGPNGAGKSTLLKLINRELRPTTGSVATRGSLKPLIRIGSGLQPMLSGRENIYVQCTQLGLSKRQSDGLVSSIVAFAELEEAIDAPVKTYSDGMYARLEFAIATSVRTDVLLVDEVLAVGDVAFQLRALDRINRLKQEGTAIVFVSHSEMNVRQVADRCLLLFAGRQVALGEPDALFYQYYASIGYLNRALKPLGASPPMPEDLAGDARLTGLELAGEASLRNALNRGERLELILGIHTRRPIEAGSLLLQFWNSAGILIASARARGAGGSLSLARGQTNLQIVITELPLSAGLYRLSASLREGETLLAQGGKMLELLVGDRSGGPPGGLIVLEADIAPVR